MNAQHTHYRRTLAKILIYTLLFGQGFQSARAASTDLADIPMAVNNNVKANVLVINDNSQSMDATMAGKLIAGDDPNTRGNIGRSVMRNNITTYRTTFNWGLMTYGMTTNPPTKYNTWGYYLGSDTGMVFTDDCVGGISATNGGRRCIANPQPFVGGGFVTYDRTGDDPDIQDVLYDTGTYPSAWGLTAGTGTSYIIYGSHNTTSGNSWATSAFSGDPFGCGNCAVGFTPTDAGFLSANPPITRQLYLARAWGYLSNITGSGTLNEPAQADSTTHFNNLMSLLASETGTTTTTEVKNGAVFTPLKGTLDAAKTYFSSSFGGQTSPIQFTCQNNFVMLVTDGLNTGTTTGSLYSTAQLTNTFNAGTGTWTFGTAAQDAINSVTALRTTTNGTKTYDIQTYVVALGDTVANANALAVMDAMANAGGTNIDPTTGKGKSFPASNQTALQNALSAISADILSRDGSAAAVAVANANVTGSDNASYASSYNSGTWIGDLIAYPIDITTGLPNNSSPIWTTGCSNPTALVDPANPSKGVKGCSAQTLLNLRTAASRWIVTSTGAASANPGIQFQPFNASPPAGQTTLSSAQQTLLNSSTTPPGPLDGAAVVAYLRGDRSQEGTNYRIRAFLLGDIVNAEPLVVREPFAHYTDDCYATAVTGKCTASQVFLTAQAARQRLVFQGANDGMLHAFLATPSGTFNGGDELWAYIPSPLLASLNGLTKMSGFVHKYYLDSTPVSGDVDFSNTSAVTGTPSPDWRTILVGGLGKGGRGFYALDVTIPPTSEANAATKVLWEFPNSGTLATVTSNVGFSFTRPVITKAGNKGWVVLVASGYNNGADTGGDGQGHLFVLDAKTGALIKDISTGVGSSTAPSGLAQLSAYVDNADLNNTVSYVYGGDLQGNVWRFDLTSTNTNQWNVVKLATLVDGATTPNPQPITTAPELANVSISGTYKRFVYVGTGQYLGLSDVSTTNQQTIYGLIDDLSTPSGTNPVIGASPSTLRGSLQQQTLTTATSTTRNLSNNAVDFSTKKGWYVDLPAPSAGNASERVNADPALVSGALIVTSNIPNSTACSPGGSSFLNVIDYKTGGYLYGSTVTWSSTYLGGALASRPVLIKLPSGQIEALVRESNATSVAIGVPLAASSASSKRMSWRELLQ